MPFLAQMTTCPACKCPKFFDAGVDVPATTLCANLGFQRKDSTETRTVPACGNLYESNPVGVVITVPEAAAAA